MRAGDTESACQKTSGIWAETFRNWERLRGWYNLVLFCSLAVGVSVRGIHLSEMLSSSFLAYFGLRILVANVCFFFGAVAESFLRLIGLDSRFTTYILFLLGAMVSLIAVLLAAIFYRFPVFD